MNEKPSAVEIGQALFGYDSGHRELASSISLSSDDKHSLLVFTDRAAPVHDMPSDGYYVGLPLKDAGAYALIRTWPAPEVERPGSVWSQALLIDYALLAKITDLSVLKTLFRRPKNSLSDIGSYRRNAKLQLFSVSESSRYFDEEGAAIMIHGVYTNTKEPAQIDASHILDAEDVVFALWSQQWPRLRRRFKFCTFCDVNKTDRFSSFDLQLFHKAPVGQRSAYLRDAMRHGVGGENKSWLSVAVEDLIGDQQGLRDFLKSKASDVSDGRRHFRRLCEIYRDTVSHADGMALANAVTQTLEAFSEREGRLLREEVLRAAAHKGEDLSIDALKTVTMAISRSEMSLPDETVLSLGQIVWRRAPTLFLDGQAPEALVAALADIVPTIDEVALIDGLQLAPQLSEKVLPLAPNLFTSERAWGSSIATALLHEMPTILENRRDDEFESDIVSAFSRAAPKAIAEGATGVFGTDVLVSKFAKSPELLRSDAGRTLANDLVRNGVARDLVCALATQPTACVESDLLATWADIARPYSVDNDYMLGDSSDLDPWLELAIASDHSTSDESSVLRLAAWILMRGLRSKGAGSAIALSYAFDPIVSSISTNQLRYDDMRIFRGDLVRADWWDWASDKDRVIRTVARKARKSDFTIEQFVGMTQSDELLHGLVDALQDKYNGRKYLENLKDQLSSASPLVGRRFTRAAL